MRKKKLIQFYLTDICNSGCKTCNIWKNRIRHDLDVISVEKVLIQNENADFVFGGGEVLLYRHLDELLSFANEHNINYTILSNCILNKKLEEVVNKYNIQNLTISCDGTLHDEIRGSKGNLEKIRNFVLNYKDKIKNLKISYVFSKYNQDVFEKDIEMFKSWGIDKIYFCLASNFVGTDEVDFRPTSLEVLLKHLDMLYDKDAKFIQALVNLSKHKCSSTGSVFTICTNGDVIRCQSYKSEEVLGNILQTSFNNVIDTLPFECEYDEKCNLVCQRRYDDYEE